MAIINVNSISSLQAAINSQPIIAAPKAGDEIVLADGVYTVMRPMAIKVDGKSGTQAAPITIRSKTSGGASITSSNGGYVVLQITNSRWVTWKDIKLPVVVT